MQQKLEDLMTPEQKETLDTLLLRIDEQAKQSKYVFVVLKKLIRKDNPKSIRINVERYNLL